MPIGWWLLPRIDRLRRVAGLPRLERTVDGRPIATPATPAAEADNYARYGVTEEDLALRPVTLESRPISARQPPVAVEYDGRNGERATKQFANAYEARRFYVAQEKAGKHPQVKKAQ